MKEKNIENEKISDKSMSENSPVEPTSLPLITDELRREEYATKRHQVCNRSNNDLISPQSLEVQGITGRVEIFRSEREGWRRLLLTDQLLPGDRIRTFSESSLDFSFCDQNQTEKLGRIGEHTHVTIGDEQNINSPNVPTGIRG